jgi:hypothetical protein
VSKQNPSSQTYTNEGALGCLARLYWMFLGNVIIFFSAISIVLNKSESFLTGLDWIFASGVFSIILFRYLDINYFKGARPDGQAATMADFWKYMRNVALSSMAVWGIAHLLKSLLA